MLITAANELGSLANAESMLFVNNRKSQTAEFYIFDKRMGAEYDFYLSILYFFDNFAFFNIAFQIVAVKTLAIEEVIMPAPLSKSEKVFLKVP